MDPLKHNTEMEDLSTEELAITLLVLKGRGDQLALKLKDINDNLENINHIGDILKSIMIAAEMSHIISKIKEIQALIEIREMLDNI